MNLYALPCGSRENGSIALGSADFLLSNEVKIQHDLVSNPAEARKVTGRGDVRATAHLPALDLAILNPPFSRSMGSNQIHSNTVFVHFLRNPDGDLDAAALPPSRL